MKIEQLNYNLVKIELEHNVMKMSIYGCYAPSDGNNYEYFLDLRRRTLEDENDEILLIGDMNTTLCHVMDRWNYQTDNHKKSRAIINNWISEGEFVDTYRAFHPETESYTFRKRDVDTRSILLQARLDYALTSQKLFGKVLKMIHLSTPYSMTVGYR